MLEWTWFWILTTVAMLFVFILYRLDGEDNEIPSTVLFAATVCSISLALYFSWPVLGEPFLAALGRTVPESGTQIHQFTVYAIATVAAGVYLVCVIGFPTAVGHKLSRRLAACRT